MLLLCLYITIFMQKSLKKEHFLWQLFNIENDIEKLNGELDSEKKKLEEVLSLQKEFDSEAEMKKKEQAGYLKELTIREKKIAKIKLELDKKVTPTMTCF